MSLLERFQKPTDPELIARTPPGQRLTKGFPVLTYGPVQMISTAKWRLSVDGLVENPMEWSWDEFNALPQSDVMRDIHCVTTWSKLDTVWRGVKFSDLAALVRPKPEAKFVMQHCYGGYTTNMPLDEMMEEDVLLAHTFDGKLLEAEHGGPVRVVVPKYYFWKSAKWVNRLEFMEKDKLGFWEMNGYHNHADPWKEERYAPPEQYRQFGQ